MCDQIRQGEQHFCCPADHPDCHRRRRLAGSQGVTRGAIMIRTPPRSFDLKMGQRHWPSAPHRCWRNQRRCRRSDHNVALARPPRGGQVHAGPPAHHHPAGDDPRRGHGDHADSPRRQPHRRPHGVRDRLSSFCVNLRRVLRIAHLVAERVFPRFSAASSPVAPPASCADRRTCAPPCRPIPRPFRAMVRG
jgi:hypothetical protein